MRSQVSLLFDKLFYKNRGYKMYRSPIFYAFVAFIISMVLVGILMPTLVCMDGWASNSIGSQGACSHHGGVNYIPVVIGVMVSYAVAFFVWRLAKKHESLIKSDDNKTIKKIEKSSATAMQLLNRFLCKFWNFIIKTLMTIGINHLFNKAPIITVVSCFILIVIIPPVALSAFILGTVAFLNGASNKTGFLVLDID
jgi:hypothetical protein